MQKNDVFSEIKVYSLDTKIYITKPIINNHPLTSQPFVKVRCLNCVCQNKNNKSESIQRCFIYE